MSQEERLLILQMVADKKISASEAAELLRALDGPAVPGEAAPGEPPASKAPKVVVVKRNREGSPEPPPLLSGLGGFIETVVERVGSVFADVVEPRYEFPEERTGEWTAAEVAIRVLTGNGRVEIRGWEQPGYKAEIMVRAGGANEEEARARAREAFTLTAAEDRFELDARRGDSLWSNLAVHLTLWVPKSKRYMVEARTGNGRVEVEQVLCREARVHTGNGKIRLNGGAVDLAQVKTGNGSVEVIADAAELEASTGNGSLTIVPIGNRHQTLRLSTGNGSMEIDTGRLPNGYGFRVDAHTGMGRVSVDLPDLVYDRDVQSMAHKHVIARTPNLDSAPFRVTVSARTGMGSVNIR